jgi:hypothetical protein
MGLLGDSGSEAREGFAVTVAEWPAKGAPCPIRPLVDSGIDAKEGLAVIVPPP